MGALVLIFTQPTKGRSSAVRHSARLGDHQVVTHICIGGQLQETHSNTAPPMMALFLNWVAGSTFARAARHVPEVDIPQLPVPHKHSPQAA